MEKFGSKLFEKFEDARILKQSLQKINGGHMLSGPEESRATGDTECTMDGQDCGDNIESTDLITDSTPTRVGQDWCD
ncbi:hypothetical protein E6C50_05655 [Flavobacterium supellecticarium]|uniref:Uncharacterized protein n=1 Tax=Flavobacterium supellecticarium TaxID=2565924 RepID=A0A4S3ZZ49_9FLAO|nr:hypothetical protein [Flavobacterium supellecticarium]THF51256.1 hypothetical protein E6C50_05655 [Flavobacterium supellecticarium]